MWPMACTENLKGTHRATSKHFLHSSSKIKWSIAPLQKTKTGHNHWQLCSSQARYYQRELWLQLKHKPHMSLFSTSLHKLCQSEAWKNHREKYIYIDQKVKQGEPKTDQVIWLFSYIHHALTWHQDSVLGILYENPPLQTKILLS